MSARGDFRKVLRMAKRKGWKIIATNPHYILEWTGGQRVTASLSPSCSHAVRNFLADMKRIERSTLDKGEA